MTGKLAGTPFMVDTHMARDRILFHCPVSTEWHISHSYMSGQQTSVRIFNNCWAVTQYGVHVAIICPQVSAMVILGAFCICLFMHTSHKAVVWTAAYFEAKGVFATHRHHLALAKDPPAPCREHQVSCMYPALPGYLCTRLQQRIKSWKCSILIISNHTKSWF